jgi:Fur family transcriptional regulator, ferric uptake regulator
VSTWTEHALRALTGAGYRRGGARRAVVEALGRQRCAATAREIEAAVHEGDRAVGRASVYRILEELERLRLVQRFDVGQGTARYERVDPAAEHHHHLVCDRCGRVMPFADPGLEDAIARLSERVRFEVDDHEVLLRGSCRACRG